MSSRRGRPTTTPRASRREAGRRRGVEFTSSPIRPRPGAAVFLLAAAVCGCAASVLAQVIDFEKLPDGSPTLDQQQICGEYAALGVTFALLDRSTGNPIGCPRIAKVGGPQNAFEGCFAPDLPRPGQGTGTTLLTDGTSIGVEGDLLVTYLTPVSQCSGIILDVDCRNSGGPPCEQWTITARDAAGTTLATRIIDAPQGATNPECVNPAAGPGDSLALGWSFALPGQKIASVLIRYTGAATTVGQAFDNFAPWDAAGPVHVVARGPGAEICSGHTVELFADVKGGLPPHSYQWQEETSPGVWTNLGTKASQLVSPPSGTSYRVRVTDSLAQVDQDARPVAVVSGAGHVVCDARLLVASGNSDRILRYDPVNRAFVDTFVAAGSGGLDGPSGFDFTQDGSLLVTSQVTNSVLRYDGTTGAFLGVFVAPGTNGPNVPVGLVVGPDGNAYVASFGNDRVRRYDGITGSFLGDFVTAGSGGLDGPTGLAFGDDGHFYVASNLTDSIKKYDGATGAPLGDLVASGAGNLDAPRGFTFHPHPGGDLYVGPETTDDVRRFDGTSGVTEGPFVTPGLGGLDRANDAVFGPEGNLYVPSYNNDRILVYGEQTGAYIGAFPTGNGLDGPGWLRFTVFCGDGRCDAATGESACSCADDCGPPPGAETHCNDGRDDDCDGLTDCGDADCAAVPLCAGAGTIPDGAALPGSPLTVQRGIGASLILAWDPSCSPADTDFVVYEGLLTLAGSHAPLTCTTAGATTWTVTAPGSGGRYYLVVPHNAAYEGSGGRTSAGTERPQGVFACLPRSVVCP